MKHSATVLLILSICTVVSCFADEDAAKLVPIPAAPVTPDELLSVMGITRWALSVPFEGSTDSQIKLFAKHKDKPPRLLIDGPVIRNKESSLRIVCSVIVTIDGLEVEPRQERLRVGVGVFGGERNQRSTSIVENPLPPKIRFEVEQVSLFMDSQKRIMLVQGNRDFVTALPFVDGNEYSIYLAVVPWNDEEKSDKNKSHGALNGSLPTRAETNRTSSATGSRR